MPGGVGVNAERTRPVLGVQRTGAELQHGLLGRVQVRHDEVEVELLRAVGPGPLRGYVLGGGLERQGLPAGQFQVDPLVLSVVLDLDGAADTSA